MSELPVKSAVELFVWEPPGRGIRVVMPWSVAERIRLDVLRAAASKRPIGGILLGRAESDLGFRTFQVEGMEPLPWAATVSAAERSGIQEAVTRHRGRVVGYFRSHGAEDLFLHAGDLVLIKSCFPEETNLFLLVKRTGDDSVATRFGFWQNGVIVSEPGDPSLPFGKPASPAPAALVPAVPAPAVVVAAPPAPYVMERPAPAPRTPPRRVLAWIAGAVLVGGLLTACVLYYQPLRRFVASGGAPAASKPTPHLGLQVEKRSSDLLVTWDGHSAPADRARRAVLAVQDGGISRSFDLDATQLRTGRVYYTPITGDVVFRLEVYDEVDQQVAESVRMLGIAMLGGLAAPAAPVNMPIPRIVVPANVQGSASRSEEETPLQAHPAYVPPAPPRVEPATVEGLPDLAPGRPSLDTPGVLRTTATPQLPPPPAAKPAVTAPAPAPTRVTSYVPPRAIHQVQPVVPANVRAMLTSSVDIEVRTSVDANGRVTRVTLSSQKGVASGFLTESALMAARNWRFEPARSEGRTIPSEVILRFRFAR